MKKIIQLIYIVFLVSIIYVNQGTAQCLDVSGMQVTNVVATSPAAGQITVTFTGVDCGNGSCGAGSTESLIYYVGIYSQTSPAPNGLNGEYGTGTFLCTNQANVDIVDGGGIHDPKASTCTGGFFGQLLFGDTYTLNSSDFVCPGNVTYAVCEDVTYDVYVWAMVVGQNPGTEFSAEQYVGSPDCMPNRVVFSESIVSDVATAYSGTAAAPAPVPISSPVVNVTMAGEDVYAGTQNGAYQSTCRTRPASMGTLDPMNPSADGDVILDVSYPDQMIPFVDNCSCDRDVEDSVAPNVIFINCRDGVDVVYDTPVSCNALGAPTTTAPCTGTPANQIPDNGAIYVEVNGTPLIAGANCVVAGGTAGAGTLTNSNNCPAGYPADYTQLFGNFLDQNGCFVPLSGTEPFGGLSPLDLPGVVTEVIDGVKRRVATLTITFEDPCNGTKSRTCVKFIEDQAEMAATFDHTQMVCPIDSLRGVFPSGSVEVLTAQGGSPDGLCAGTSPANYTLELIPAAGNLNATGTGFENLPPGTYTVVVHDPNTVDGPAPDANGTGTNAEAACPVTYDFTIFNKLPATVSANATVCPGECTTVNVILTENPIREYSISQNVTPGIVTGGTCPFISNMLLAPFENTNTPFAPAGGICSGAIGTGATDATLMEVCFSVTAGAAQTLNDLYISVDNGANIENLYVGTGWTGGAETGAAGSTISFCTSAPLGSSFDGTLDGNSEGGSFNGLDPNNFVLFVGQLDNGNCSTATINFATITIIDRCVEPQVATICTMAGMDALTWSGDLGGPIAAASGDDGIFLDGVTNESGVFCGGALAAGSYNYTVDGFIDNPAFGNCCPVSGTVSVLVATPLPTPIITGIANGDEFCDVDGLTDITINPLPFDLTPGEVLIGEYTPSANSEFFGFDLTLPDGTELNGYDLAANACNGLTFGGDEVANMIANMTNLPPANGSADYPGMYTLCFADVGGAGLAGATFTITDGFGNILLTDADYDEAACTPVCATFSVEPAQLIVTGPGIIETGTPNGADGIANSGDETYAFDPTVAMTALADGSDCNENVITVTFVNGNGCTSVDSVAVTVYDTPTAGAGPITKLDTECAADFSVTFTAADMLAGADGTAGTADDLTGGSGSYLMTYYDAATMAFVGPTPLADITLPGNGATTAVTIIDEDSAYGSMFTDGTGAVQSCDGNACFTTIFLTTPRCLPNCDAGAADVTAEAANILCPGDDIVISDPTADFDFDLAGGLPGDNYELGYAISPCGTPVTDQASVDAAPIVVQAAPQDAAGPYTYTFAHPSGLTVPGSYTVTPFVSAQTLTDNGPAVDAGTIVNPMNSSDAYVIQIPEFPCLNNTEAATSMDVTVTILSVTDLTGGGCVGANGFVDWYLDGQALADNIGSTTFNIADPFPQDININVPVYNADNELFINVGPVFITGGTCATEPPMPGVDFEITYVTTVDIVYDTPFPTIVDPHCCGDFGTPTDIFLIDDITIGAETVLESCSDSTYTVTFTPTGGAPALNGDACNTYNTAYEVTDPNALSISPAGNGDGLTSGTGTGAFTITYYLLDDYNVSVANYDLTADTTLITSDQNDGCAQSLAGISPPVFASANNAMNYEICGGGTIPAGEGLMADCPACPDASAATLTWWDAPVGGNQVGSGTVFDPNDDPNFDINVFGVTPYYAECGCTEQGCPGPRLTVYITVFPQPIDPTLVQDNFDICTEDGTPTIEVDAASIADPSTVTFLWFDGVPTDPATDPTIATGTSIMEPNPIVAGTYTYCVVGQSATGPGGFACYSNPTCATVEINQTPPPPVVISPPSIVCQGSVLTLGDALEISCTDCPFPSEGAADASWWDAPTGGTMLSASSTFIPPVDTNVPGVYTFYAECSCGACQSPRTAASITVLEDITATIGSCDCCAGGNPQIEISSIAGGLPELGGGDAYTVTATGGTIDNANPVLGGTVNLTLDDDGGSWEVTITDMEGCTFYHSGYCEPCCQSEAGILSIGDNVFCAEEQATLTVSNDVVFPDVCILPNILDDNDNATGTYKVLSYVGAPGPIGADFYADLADPTLCYASLTDATLTNGFSVANGAFPSNTIVYFTGVVLNENGQIQDNDGTAGPDCGDASNQTPVVFLDPITATLGACACMDGQGVVSISGFDGGVPAAITALGADAAILGLEQTYYTISANDGQVLLSSTGEPVSTVAVGDVVEVMIPDGGNASILVSDSEGCPVEFNITCDPCGCDAGSINTTDHIVCPGETVQLNAFDFAFPENPANTDGDASSGTLHWDYYFDNMPSPVDPYATCGGTAGDATDIMSGVLDGGANATVEIQNIAAGGFVPTPLGSNLPTNTNISIAASAYDDAGGINCDDEGCAIGYANIVFLEELAATFTACDCTVGGNPQIQIGPIAGGLPAYDGSSYIIETTGGFVDNLLPTTGDVITFTLIEDGGSWGVTIIDLEGCELELSGTCTPCCEADAGHIDVTDRTLCADQVITIIAEDVNGYPVDHAGGGLEDGSSESGMYVFQFIDASTGALIGEVMPMPGDFPSPPFGVTDGLAPTTSIVNSLPGGIALPFNVPIQVTGSALDDNANLNNTCTDATEATTFVQMAPVVTDAPICDCSAGTYPVVTIGGFDGGEPAALDALTALGLTFDDINDANYYLTANGGDIIGGASTAAIGDEIQISVTDADGNWALTVEDDNGCKTVISGMCVSCCVLEISASESAGSCGGLDDGSIVVSVDNNPNNLSLEFALIEGGGPYTGNNAGPFQDDPVFDNLPTGTYSVIAHNIFDYTCQDVALDLVVGQANFVGAPTTENAAVCQLNGTAISNTALSATCVPCPAGVPAGDITWWTSAIGGTLVHTGDTFDPIAEGYISIDDFSHTVYYAQCACGPCVSPRTPADFDVNPCCDISIDEVTPTSPTCNDDAEGSLEVTAFSSSNDVEFALVPDGTPFSTDSQNALPFQTSPIFTDLAPGDYVIAIRDILSPTTCLNWIAVTLETGIDMIAPEVTEGYVCTGNSPADQPLQADCSANTCDLDDDGNPEFSSTVTWWTEAELGTLIATGNTFDPIAAGYVNTNIVDTITYFVQCECGPCVSERIAVPFIVRALPEVKEIDGDASVCPGETVSYAVVDPVAGNSYDWSIPAGAGTITGNGNPAINVEWSTDPPNGVGPYALTVTETDGFGCVQTSTLDITIETLSQLWCNDNVNTTLGEECTIDVFPDVVIENPSYEDESYAIIVYNEDGSIAAESGVDADGNFLAAVITGEGNYTYNLIHLCSGQACWGNILAEDKGTPTITCPEDISDTEEPDFMCADLDEIYTPEETVYFDNTGAEEILEDLVPGNPTGDDNCPLYTITYQDALQEGGLCGIDVITRTFTITDMVGLSSTCEQTINIRRATLADVVAPQNIELSCDQFALFDPATLSDANVEGAYPLVNSFFDSHELAQTYCNLGATFTDGTPVQLCGNGQKIVRNWTVYDWCANESVVFTQVIKIEDTDAPVVFCDNATTQLAVSASSGACAALTIVAPIEYSENCSEPVTVSVTVIAPDGTTQEVSVGDQLALGLGLHELVYLVADDCGNVAAPCSNFINVFDGSAPVTICDQHTVAALGADGLAEVCWDTFDDGSYDNCAESITIRVKRMDASAETEFSECVVFSCEDVGTTIMVRMRVWDNLPDVGFPDAINEGRWNECMIEVEVQDKLDPMLVCPPDLTLECFEDYSNIEGLLSDEDGLIDENPPAAPAFFGNNDNFIGYYTGATDNCDLTVLITESGSIDNCGEGTISRRFTATDASGNTATCRQRIRLINSNPFTEDNIEWPADTIVTCLGDVDFENLGAPIINNAACDQIAVTYDDTVLPINDDACFKILREWQVLDWCNFDVNNDGTFDGYWTETQIIKVVDDNAPVIISDCSDFDECNFNDDCAPTYVELILEATDGCAEDLNYSYVIDLFDDNEENPAADGIIGNTNDASGDFENGTHHIYWTVEDGCGNLSYCDYEFKVVDCKKPSPVCLNGLSTVVMPSSGQIELWDIDFNGLAGSGSFDNCTAEENLRFRIRIVYPDNNVLTSLNQVLNLDNNVIFNCENLGFPNVELYVIDEAGNWDYCTTYVSIQDPNLVCTEVTELADIAGQIETEMNEMVEEVTMSLSGGTVPLFPIVTGSDGQYEFLDNTMYSNYTVTPEKDMNPLNGVTTFDLVLIQQHVLGINTLDSPYKIIAADANHSNAVTTFDVVTVRRLILGLDQTFSANTSWRFVDKDFVFPDVTNPFVSIFPEVISFNDLSQDELAADFVGVKIGDINNSAVPNTLLGIQDRNTKGDLFFAIEDQKLVAGETYDFVFEANDFEAITGYQFTLSFDENVLEFNKVNTGELKDLSEGNFGLNRLAEGMITTSWNTHNAVSLRNGQEVFQVSFTAKADAQLSEVININSSFTVAEAYNKNTDLLNIGLTFKTAHGTIVSGGQFELYQNRPNPFNEVTTIGFFLPESGKASLTIFDVSGKVLTTVEGDFARGYNEFNVKRNKIDAAGLLYYSLETANDTATKRMILID